MEYVQRSGLHVLRGNGGADAPVLYVVDDVSHPFAEVDAAAQGLTANLVIVPVKNWNEALTPWASLALRRGAPDFGGHAATTCEELLSLLGDGWEHAHGLAPSRRGIVGYSLGGLFALWAFIRTGIFDGVASLSGSLWYEGWVDYVHALDVSLTGKQAYLCMGKKERKAPNRIMRCVADNTQATAERLHELGCEVTFAMGPGDHFHFVKERFAAGFAALDRALA